MPRAAEMPPQQPAPSLSAGEQAFALGFGVDPASSFNPEATNLLPSPTPYSSPNHFGDINSFFQPIQPDASYAMSLDKPATVDAEPLPVDLEFNLTEVAKQADFGAAFFEWKADWATEQKAKTQNNIAFGLGSFIVREQMERDLADFFADFLGDNDNDGDNSSTKSTKKKSLTLAA